MHQRIHKGFTLVELTLAISLLALISPLFFDSFSAWINWQERSTTRARLNDIEQALHAAYQDSLILAEQHTQAILILHSGQINPITPNATGQCPDTPEGLQALSRYTTQTSAQLMRDGGQNPLCIFISPQQNSNMYGSPLFYHDIGIASVGKNAHLDQTNICQTGFDSHGKFTLCGDDEGIHISGLVIAENAYRLTRDKLKYIADTYQSYAHTRFQLNSARDVAIDYFASAGLTTTRWDIGNGIPSSGCNTFSSLWNNTLTSPSNVLGLSNTDVIDAYGQMIEFDNCSNRVRSPDHPDINKQTPPYTAILRTFLPGNVEYIQTIVGNY